MSIDLTQIAVALIALLATIITYKIIPWIKGKTTEKQRANLAAAAKVVVFAAQQIFGAGNGSDKLAYAMEKLREAGFNLDDEALRVAIEAAVYEMKQSRADADAIS